MPVLCPPRPTAPGVALIVPVLALALGLGVASGCSDDKDRRDRNYGTDVGAGYQLPDGNLDRMPETVPGPDAGDGPAAEAAVPDGPPGDAAAEETSDAAPFQDTVAAADTETGG